MNRMIMRKMRNSMGRGKECPGGRIRCWSRAKTTTKAPARGSMLVTRTRHGTTAYDIQGHSRGKRLKDSRRRVGGSSFRSRNSGRGKRGLGCPQWPRRSGGDQPFLGAGRESSKITWSKGWRGFRAGELLRPVRLTAHPQGGCRSRSEEGLVKEKSA